MRPITKKIACIATSALLGMTLLVGCTDTGATGTGKNTDDSFSMVATWTSSGLVNHYDSNTNGVLDGVEITDANWDTFHSVRPTFLSTPSSLHPKLEAMSAADAYE